MSEIVLLHGTNQILKKPKFELGKKTNDYGRGFYCTKDTEMAKEWACKQKNDGFVNKYVLDDSVLKTLNLLDGNYTVLNWIALLLKHRVFTINDEIAQDAKEYIIENYSIDTSTYDVIIGYRADDSYFSYAQSFVHNALPVRCLSKAMQLGKLGVQIVLVSERAFKYLKFVQADPVDKEIYYPKFLARDTQARNDYHRVLKKSKSLKDDLFVIDIMRGEIKNDDSRIQRIVLQ